ncbi:MAG: ABC transporter substrate-binding protein [Lachnospiraceae bacterium]|nr:ABC transporter substrate-binding protein [Lachnospiraceae bacterium]
MRKSIKKRILSLLLAAVMAFLAVGCGGQDASITSEHPAGEASQGNSSTAGQQEDGQSIAIDDVEPDETAAMGRYVEEEIDISEYSITLFDMQKLDDGSLIILSQSDLPIISKDNGATWEVKEIQWFKECFEKSDYICSAKTAPDGTIGVVYSEHGDEDMRSKVVLIEPDGTVIPVEVSMENDEANVREIWVSDTGRFFVTSYRDRNIYEVKRDGTSEIFLSPQQRADYVQVRGNVAAVDSYANAERVFELFDIETKEPIEDEVLQSFLKDYYGERSSNGNYWYNMVYTFDEDNVIYLAGRKGLHRHVIGGSAVEQVIDGGLSRIGSPDYGIVRFLPLNDTEFIALFSNFKVIKFTYDPDVPTVPNNRVKIYSLEEESDIRIAISLYQVKHPDMFIEYEVGMESGSSVTRDDALKKLNTQIIAGEGPDLLCLNGLPIDSYVEKGLLKDISGLIDDLGKEEDLFENLFQALERDGVLYMAPGQISMVMLGGHEEYLSQMNDLKSIADGMEKLRKDNPGVDLLGMAYEKQIMKAFALASAPAWKTENGELNRETVEEFLTQTKRIYDAQMDGLDEKYIERYAMLNDVFTDERGEDWMYNNLFYIPSETDLLANLTQLEIGWLTFSYGFYEELSVPRNEGGEGIVFKPASVQCSNVFRPDVLLGISTASTRTEYAEDFLKEFLSKDTQVAMEGLSANKDAMREIFIPKESVLGANGEYGSIGTLDWEGNSIGLQIYFPDQEQIEDYYQMVESMDTPYLEDLVLEETVYEEGYKFMQGEQSLEEALNAIEQKIAIYLAE